MARMPADAAASIPAAPLPRAIGKYRVLSRLGEGATSEVFLARDDFLGREVAIKRVHPAAALGPVEVLETNDLRQGYRDLPPTDGLRLAFNGGRVIIRPSGTEPKLKCYVEVVDRSESLARDTAEAISAALRDYLAAATRTGTNAL